LVISKAGLFIWLFGDGGEFYFVGFGAKVVALFVCFLVLPPDV
jgi:sorbitol-specific phosphotransferase system component IIC